MASKTTADTLPSRSPMRRQSPLKPYSEYLAWCERKTRKGGRR